MSWVTNTMLHFGNGGQAALDKVNAFFTDGPGHGPGFVSVDDPALPRGWYGGSKMLECSVAIGALTISTFRRWSTIWLRSASPVRLMLTAPNCC